MRGSGFIVLLLFVAVVASPAFGIGASAIPLKLDMGTADSPVADGFTRVTADQEYTAERGFGWVGKAYTAYDTSPPEKEPPFVQPRPSLVYKEGANALTRDGVWSDGDMSFRVDLPNGKYRVWLTIGDLEKMLGSISVYANDQLIAKDLTIRHIRWRSQQNQGDGWYLPLRFTAEVKEGSLTIRLHGDDSEYQRLQEIERAKPQPPSYGTYPDHPEKKPRDYVLRTDIGLPFVGNSILGLEVYPYQGAAIEFKDGKLVGFGPPSAWLWEPGNAIRLFNEGKLNAAAEAASQLAAQAVSGFQDPWVYERGMIYLALAGNPEVDNEREMAANAVRDLSAVVEQRPEDYRAKELLWMAKHLREGIERFHHRDDFGANGYSDVLRGSMELAVMEPEDPAYWQAQVYRARIFYMIQPHRWSWVSGAGEDILLAVEKKFPQNRFVKLYLDGEWKQSKEWPIKDYVSGTEGAPEWAVALRDAWRLNLDHARWWIENKQREDGSLGGGWGDDVELIVDFANYVFVSEGVDEDVLNGVKKLVEGNWLYSGIDQDAGFYWGVADVGHSAEPTTDTLPMMIFLDYGNPVYVERCMKSGKLMRDLWMAVNPKGHFHFRSDYLGALGIGGGTVANDGWLNYRAAIPAEKVLWYTNNPTLANLFDRWATALLEDTMKSERGKPAGVMPSVVSFSDCTLGGVNSPSWYKSDNTGGFNPDWGHGYSDPKGYPLSLLGGAYERSGDQRFLEPFRIQAELALEHKAKPTENPEEGSLEWVRKGLFESGAPELWEFVQKRELGTDPQGARFMTREDAKTEGDFVRTRIKMRWPIDTTEALVTDRVGFGGITRAAAVYGGGGIFMGNPTVDYLGIGADFAAVVLRADRTHLRVLLYSFYNEPKDMGMRPWMLAPGTNYKAEIGPDVNGDEELDRADRSWAVDLAHRGQAVMFTLPPKVETILTLTAAEKPGFGPGEVSPDAALSAGDVEFWKDRNHLVVKVHNIGSAPIVGLEVEAWEGKADSGKLIGKSLIPYIEAPNDLDEQTVRVGLGWKPEGPKEVTIVLDPKNEIEEITDANNVVHLVIDPKLGVNKAPERPQPAM